MATDNEILQEIIRLATNDNTLKAIADHTAKKAELIKTDSEQRISARNAAIKKAWKYGAPAAVVALGALSCFAPVQTGVAIGGAVMGVGGGLVGVGTSLANIGAVAAGGVNTALAASGTAATATFAGGIAGTVAVCAPVAAAAVLCWAGFVDILWMVSLPAQCLLDESP